MRNGFARNRCSSWVAVWLLAWGASCGSTGSAPPQPPTPIPPAPTPPGTVHNLVVLRHLTANIDDTRVDTIFGEMGDILQTNDGLGDIACDVGFTRNGTTGTFAVGNGIINSLADFNAVNNLPGNVKVVRQINWCGNLQPNVIGCAPIPGTSMVVVRFNAAQESVLWAHEFGHNRGLNHRNVPDVVMNPVIGLSHLRIDPTECAAYQ